MSEMTNKDTKNKLIDIRANILTDIAKLHQLYDDVSDKITFVPPFIQKIPNELLYIGDIPYEKESYSVFIIRNSANLANIIIGSEQVLLDTYKQRWQSLISKQESKYTSNDNTIINVYQAIYPYITFARNDLRHEDDVNRCDNILAKLLTKVLDRASHTFYYDIWFREGLSTNKMRSYLRDIISDLIYWGKIQFEYMEIKLFDIPMQPRVKLLIDTEDGNKKKFTYLDR